MGNGHSGVKQVEFEIKRELHKARQRLLDLTLRNRLLNFKSMERRTIKVINEIPNEVFDILVLQERVMQFRPSEKPAEGRMSLFDEDTAVLPWWEDTESEEHHTDRFLQTELAKEDLQRRLYYTHQQARSVFEEQGIRYCISPSATLSGPKMPTRCSLIMPR